jgi:catalase
VSATAAGAKRDASKAYFDIYQGPNEQDSIINDPSTQHEYTLSGGQPSALNSSLFTSQQFMLAT